MQKRLEPSEVLVWGLSVYGASTFTSMAGMSLGLGVFVLCLLWSWRWGVLEVPTARMQLRSSPRVAQYARNSALLAGACALSLVGARWFPVIYAGQSPQVRWVSDLLKLVYFLVPLGVAWALTCLSAKQQKRVLWNWLGVAGVVGFLALPQFFTGWPRPQAIPGLANRFHATLFFGHHLSTASILIFPFFIALSLVVGKSTLPHPKLNSRLEARKRLALISFLLGIALFLTWSRTLWIALPIGLAVWVFRYVRRIQAVGLIATSGGALVAALSLIPALQERLVQTIGTSDRFELWRANLSFFLARPWTGIGWRKSEGLTAAYFESVYGGDISHRFVGHAHNNLLEMLAGTGLLGFLAWIVWVVWFFRLSLEVSKRQDFLGEIGWGVFCAGLVFQLNGLTQVNFWEGKVLHQLMWSVSLLIFSSILPSENQEQI